MERFTPYLFDIVERFTTNGCYYAKQIYHATMFEC